MIKLNHADKYYNRGKSNQLHVMNDISLELPEAGLVAVFGKSGCGKTTLLNTIGGLDRLNSGTILVNNENMAGNADFIRNRYIGYIFQNYNLTKSETVYENVADALRLCGMEDRAEIYERTISALANVGMEKFKNRLPDTLSGGQQQRVAIARAIVKNPSIILADEPTGNLDEANTIMIMDILKQLSREHLVLLVTHEANLVDFYCDRVIEIVDGAINSVRDNENANGFTGRNKNDIYLGELSKNEACTGGVRVEYFGEPQGEIKLRIISINGRLFLKSETPGLRILDDSSEIVLHEGVFEESGENGNKASAAIDMSHLKPIKEGKTGRLFTFGSALTSGYRENFSKKGKKGRRILCIGMFLLAMIVVFMSANFAVGIRAFLKLNENRSDNIYFVPLTSETDTSAVTSHIGENGIEYARVINSNYINSTETIEFRVGNFVTASTNPVYASGKVLDAKLSENLTLVCGTKEFSKPLDTIITTALADDMIESSSASFINDYSDLLNMVSYNKYDGDNYLRITGIVESNEKNYYLESIYATYVILKNVYTFNFSAVPKSLDTISKVTPEKGSVVIQSVKADAYNTGDTILIMGRKYTVSQAEMTYMDIGQYQVYVQNKYNIKLLDFQSYMNEKLSENPAYDQTKLMLEWFFDYYNVYLSEFLSQCYNLDYYTWLYSRMPNNKAYMVESAISTGNNDIWLYDTTLYAGYLYKTENGEYPTEEQLNLYIKQNSDYENTFYEALSEADKADYWSLYDEYSWNKSGTGTRIIMNDDDFIALAYTTGSNDSTICPYELFGSWEDTYNGTMFYEHYLLIYAGDTVKAGEYLTSEFGSLLITPAQVYEEQKNESLLSITVNLISLAVVLVLICMCVFFIMRSSLMSRVKEIGIYRAIGVSKENLTFRFLIESLVLSTLSLFIGYVVSSFIVVKLTGYSLFAEIFYFPPWLIILLLVFLYAITALFGILPVRILLRKTPSEILAKYDI